MGRRQRDEPDRLVLEQRAVGPRRHTAIISVYLALATGRLTNGRSPARDLSSSMSRIPGRNRAPSVIAPPIAAAPTRVARAPTRSATGAVSAKDNGNSPIEISQSRLETRPSIDAGTCRCLIVAQTIVPAVSSALKSRQATMRLRAARAGVA